MGWTCPTTPLPGAKVHHHVYLGLFSSLSMLYISVIFVFLIISVWYFKWLTGICTVNSCMIGKFCKQCLYVMINFMKMQLQCLVILCVHVCHNLYSFPLNAPQDIDQVHSWQSAMSHTSIRQAWSVFLWTRCCCWPRYYNPFILFFFDITVTINT